MKAVAALQADLAVLREENAQLRVSSRRISAETSLARLRDLTVANRTPAPTDSDPVDSTPTDPTDDRTWQTMTDMLVMRDVLLEMCDQIQLLGAQMRVRLARLGPPAASDGPS